LEIHELSGNKLVNGGHFPTWKGKTTVYILFNDSNAITQFSKIS